MGDYLVLTPPELSDLRAEDQRDAELTDRPFTKEEAQARWTPAQVQRISAALVVHGD